MRFFLVAILAAWFAVPASAEDFAPQLESMITGYIRPATEGFAEAAGTLPGAVEAVCQQADESAMAGFRTAYAQTVGGFARVYFLRFGPLLEDDRLSRLAFMPDPRGIGMRQIRKLYAEKDESALTVGGLADKSVAVQGLTALELIAFDKNGQVRLGQPDDDKDYSCSYALAIAENISDLATALAADWADQDGYSQVLLSAEAGNGPFQSSKEALETVFNSLVTGLIISRDQGLLPALGKSEAKAKPKRFPFSRSQNSVLFLSGELHGIEDGLASLNLKELTPDEFTWIFDTLAFEFGNAQGFLAKLKPPLRTSFGKGDSYKQVAILAITEKSILETISRELAGALELTGGFNALDGD